MTRFTVEFRMYGNALYPDAVTELLALKPCHVMLPGARRGSRIVEEAIAAIQVGRGMMPRWPAR